MTAGIGAVTAKAGGSNTVSVLRFSNHNIQIHAGETVEWDNQDPITPHTITFGTDPVGDPEPPSPDVTVDHDGARHAIIDSTADSTHSGFIVAAPQERLGLPQAAGLFRPAAMTFGPDGGLLCLEHRIWLSGWPGQILRITVP